MNRFILKYFLGYDDVIMNSIKKVSDRENHTGNPLMELFIFIKLSHV